VLGVDYDIDRCFDLDDATKVRMEGGRIVEISKVLSSYNALDSGVFRIGPSLIEALDDVYRQKGDCSLSDGVRTLSQRGEFFGSDIGSACWVDVDTPEAARHAAHLVRLLGDDLEGRYVPRPDARAAFPGVDASVWQARSNAGFAAVPDAE
jgi:choline kinase